MNSSSTLCYYAAQEAPGRPSEPSVCVCVFRLNVAFIDFSVISQWYMVARGSSMLTFIVQPH